MTKLDAFLSEHGGKISESIGITPRSDAKFHGETDGPNSMKNNDKYAGRSNNRATGVREMEISRILADPTQPRRTFDQPELKRLASTIKKHGVMQPISVRWSDEVSKWIIIDGERRFRASKIAGIATIPCVFHEKLSDEHEIRVRQIIANLMREDLLPIEQAEAFTSLMELTGWNNQQLASEINVSKATVTRSLTLLSLPEEIQTKVDQGEIASSVAYELSRVPGERKQISLANQIIRQELNRHEAIERARVAASESKRTPDQPTPRRRKTVKEFSTRHATVLIRHDKPDATSADLQKELLNVVKQLGKETVM